MNDAQKMAEEMARQQMAQAAQMIAQQQAAVEAALRAAGMPDPTAMLQQAMAMREAMMQGGGLQQMMAQQQQAAAAAFQGGIEGLQDDDEYDADVPPEISPADRFALSLSAIVFEINGSSHAWLEGDTPRKPWLRTECEHVLREWWSVESIKELKDIVEWLSSEGHAAVFVRHRAALQAASGDAEKAFEALAAAAEDDLDADDCAEIRRRLALLQGDLSGVEHIQAWDCGRAVAVLRWGAGAGLLTQAEAWRQIRAFAPHLRTLFPSWEAFAANYLDGLRFWNGDEDMAEECREAIASLLDAGNAESPWNQVAWSA